MLPSRKAHAFSLLETLCVLGCIAVAMGALGGTSWHVLSSMQLRGAATEFVQAARTARQYAVDHRCRTRLTFRAGLWTENPDSTTGEEERSYRIHAFIIPSETASPGDTWEPLEADGALASTTIPALWTRRHPVARTEAMVGRWLGCADSETKPRLLPENVRLTSPLLQRFHKEAALEFFTENYRMPESTWKLEGADPFELHNALSPFPENYGQTPIDRSPVLISAPLHEDDECYDVRSGGIVEAATLWPGTVQTIRGFENTAMAELPGIEFLPNGALACTWTDCVIFDFHWVQRPAETGYRVLIDTATGVTRLETGLAP